MPIPPSIDYEREFPKHKEKYKNLPSKKELVRALTEIKVSSKEKRMLAAHYSAPNRTVTAGELAQTVGYKSYRAINGQYGKLAGNICTLLERFYGHQTRVLALICRLPYKNDKVNWIMHPQAAQALEELGWVDSGVLEEEDWERTLEEDFRAALVRPPEERLARLAEAPRLPGRVEVRRREFRRNPDVIAEVLLRARGRCEGCRRKAPFVRRSDGSPYLEIHHEITLAEGGEDTVDNATALCPNCHRRRHHG